MITRRKKVLFGLGFALVLAFASTQIFADVPYGKILRPGAITSTMIAPGAVTASSIADGSIGNVSCTGGLVASGGPLPGNVTCSIADGGINGHMLAPGSVGSVGGCVLPNTVDCTPTVGGSDGGTGGGSGAIVLTPTPNYVVGTTEQVVASVYFTSTGTISTLRAYLGCAVSTDTCRLKLYRSATSSLVNTLSTTSAITGVSTTNVPITATGWYEFHLVGATSSAIAQCTGIRVDGIN